ncbi:MAG: hypothetical protein IJ418_01920 [Clostridia bacterium]|nr:hypothetical protein [Clostridia bacterium]MBQ8616247.1 hypothetical protein [Clostridia bacterium]
MPTYEQNKKSAEKYLATMDRITIRSPKESNLKRAIQEHADSMGESVNAFIIRAITQAMEQDNASEK